MIQHARATLTTSGGGGFNRLRAFRRACFMMPSMIGVLKYLVQDVEKAVQHKAQYTVQQSSWGCLGSILSPSWGPFGALLALRVGSLRGPGEALGPSWGPLGGLLKPKSPCGPFLGASWGLLGAPWGPLGGLLGPPGGLFGQKDRIVGVCSPSWASLGALWGLSWAVMGAS